jgi:hypothetical protein
MVSTKIRDKSGGKMRSIRLWVVLLVPVIALILGNEAPQALASGWTIEECEDGLDQTAVFFEFNSTDCDAGIQFFWDGPAWKSMIVKDKHGREVLDVFPLRNVRAVGLTEGRFEGDEPQLISEDKECYLEDENVLEAIKNFITQYKKGKYTFKGMAAKEKCFLLGDTKLTYNILQPVVFDEIDLPEISWNAPSGVLFPPGSSEVVSYEIVIELVVEASDEQVFKETTTLPGDATSYSVSQTFMDLIESFEEDIVELKIEILADEPSGNRTITEEVLIEAED